MAHTNAAEDLTGRTLSTGWYVAEKVPKPPGATGGFFSVCYRVQKDGEECFLKALNFASFMTLSQPGRPILDVMAEMIEAYKYERDLSAMCRDKHVTKVSFVRDAGEELVSGYAITVVPYLVFDVADGGDARSHLTFATGLEAVWKLRSLHSIAVGLKQLHSIDVSHQDVRAHLAMSR